ncbi:hypothetical protein JCM6882_000761 [Rhodosporidiobolus microsporus]
MSINPALLMMSNSPQAPAKEAPAAEQPQGGDADEEFEIERILDYKLVDNEEWGTFREEWEPDGLRWEVRFFINNSWEPARNFAGWNSEYDKTIKAIRKEKGRERLKDLEADAKEKNRAWKKAQKKEAKARKEEAKADVKRLTGSALLTGRKKKKDKGDKDKKEKSNGKEKEKRKGKGKEKEQSVSSASPAPSASSFTQQAPRRTRTSRADELFTAEAIEDMARHGNLPPELRNLRRTPPPKHDADDNLIQSSSEAGSVSPQLERTPLPSTSHQQYVGASAFELPAEAGVFDPYGQQPSQAFSSSAAPSHHPYAGAAPSAATGAADGGFAASSDGEGEQDQSGDLGGFDDHFDQPMQDVSGVSAASFNGEPAVVGGVPQQSGWAGESDEDEDEVAMEQHSPAPPAAPGPTPGHQFNVVVDQQSSSVHGGDSEAAQVPADFAGSGSEDGDEAIEAAQRPTEPTKDGGLETQPAQAGGFAASDDEDNEQGNEQLKDLFAGTDSDDEAPAAPPKPAAASAPLQRASASRPSSRAPSRAHSRQPSRPPSRPTSQPPYSRYSRESASPQLVTIRRPPQSPPPKKRQDRGEGKADKGKWKEKDKGKGREKEKERVKEKDMPAPAKPSAKAPIGVTKLVKLTPKGSSSTQSSRPPPAPAGLQENRALGPPKKKAKRVVESDDEDAGDAAISTKQALSGLGKIGKKPTGPRNSLDTAAIPAAPSPPSADSASAGQSSLSSALKTQKDYDPWNQGVERPTAKNGYVVINRDFLSRQKLTDKINRTSRVKFPPELFSDADKVRFFWQIGNNPLDGTDDFDAVLLNDGEPREVYIMEPPSSKQVGINKFARFQQNDYSALQLVLSTLEGVKQADSPRDSVSAVFIHVHKASELGRFPGKLAELEKFRTRDDVVFYVYGETEKGKIVFKRVWRSGAAITFTPAALARDHVRLSTLVEQQANSRDLNLRDRHRFPWVPLQYLLPGGAFGLSIDESSAALPPTAEQDLDKRAARLNLCTLLAHDHLSLIRVAPVADSQPYNLAAFPRVSDRMPLTSSAWTQVAEWYPSKYCDLSVAKLQELVCEWRVRYPQLRRWIIIATPEELELCPASPGVDLLTLSQAEELLAHPL